MAGFFVSTTATPETSTGSPLLMAAARWAGRSACEPATIPAKGPAETTAVPGAATGPRRCQVRAVSMVARASARGRCRVVRS